ncbi:hypothetical protein L596_022991 [Steinernema carpocapsae]|uniref:Uncharacterized protein n=1 Tax=Steinernema carpocapsae TaxID=34508 RepID=A0A4U5MCC2_STECR|nr:hypothetical protein L596_022991 [Steinernema carpocapsae]
MDFTNVFIRVQKCSHVRVCVPLPGTTGERSDPRSDYPAPVNLEPNEEAVENFDQRSDRQRTTSERTGRVAACNRTPNTTFTRVESKSSRCNRPTTGLPSFTLR